jgi:hypothetical protein
MTSMNDRNLKFFTPIFTNPVGWARWIGNSLKFVFVCFLVHLLFVTIGFGFIYIGLINTGLEPQRALNLLLPGFFPIVFIGIIYPTMYAYAIFRLLKIIDKANEP